MAYIRRLRNHERWDASPSKTMNVHSSEKVPVNTLYGPDDSLLHTYTKKNPSSSGFNQMIGVKMIIWILVVLILLVVLLKLLGAY